MKTGYPIFLPPPPQHAPDSSFHRTLCLFCVFFLLSLSLSPSFLFLSMILRQLALAFTYHEEGGESFSRAQRAREGVGEIKQIRGKESKGTLSPLGNENCSQAGRERKKRRIAPLLSRGLVLSPAAESFPLSFPFFLSPRSPSSRARAKKKLPRNSPRLCHRGLSSFPSFLPPPSSSSLPLFRSRQARREEKRMGSGVVSSELRVRARAYRTGPAESWFEVGRRGPTEGASHARLGHEPRPSDLLTISIALLVLTPSHFRLLRNRAPPTPPPFPSPPFLPSAPSRLPPFLQLSYLSRQR